jgi:hypothetical protein
MKRDILFLKALCVLGVTPLFLFSICLAQETEGWKTQKSTHFIIYYKNAPEDFIRQLIEKSEDYYNKIADDLGFRRFDFWLWDKRAKIYIYDDAEEYQAATGQPAWSSGAALPKAKIIQSYPYAQGFLDVVLPHEMGHIIFREFVGFNNYAIPLWLEEGVACYQEKLKYLKANELIRNALDSGEFITLEALANFNPQSARDNKVVELFYAEAFSIVDFLIKEFGKDKFVIFCQKLRDKMSLEKAIAATYPTRSIQELDQAWQKYLRSQ